MGRARARPRRSSSSTRTAGLGFGPDVSTSTHATLGGMIGNRSAGSGSLVHGMTDEHVLAIDAVFADGTTDRLSTHPVGTPSRPAGRNDWPPARRHRPSPARGRDPFPVPEGAAQRRWLSPRRRARTISQPSPRVELARFVERERGHARGHRGGQGETGRSSHRTHPAHARLPRRRVRVARVPDLVGTFAAAVELMDAFIIEAAAVWAVFREDVALLPTVDGGKAGGGALRRVPRGRDSNRPRRRPTTRPRGPRPPVERRPRLSIPLEQRRLWSIRTTGLGLISKPDGPVSRCGLEDCGVPLESLPRFQREFDALIRGHGWEGVFYARVRRAPPRPSPHRSLEPGGPRRVPRSSSRDARSRAAPVAVRSPASTGTVGSGATSSPACTGPPSTTPSARCGDSSIRRASSIPATRPAIDRRWTTSASIARAIRRRGVVLSMGVGRAARGGGSLQRKRARAGGTTAGRDVSELSGGSTRTTRRGDGRTPFDWPSAADWAARNHGDGGRRGESSPSACPARHAATSVRATWTSAS